MLSVLIGRGCNLLEGKWMLSISFTTDCQSVEGASALGVGLDGRLVIVTSTMPSIPGAGGGWLCARRLCTVVRRQKSVVSGETDGGRSQPLL